MDTFHLFIDANQNAIAVHNNADAIDAAQTFTLEKRISKKPVDAGLADLFLSQHGGFAIYEDRCIAVAAI